MSRLGRSGRRSNLIRNVSLLLSAFLGLFANYGSAHHTKKTHEFYTQCFRQFIQVCGDVPLRKVSPQMIDTYLSKKTRESSPWTARNHYIALASMFETAKRWKKIKVNPFREVKRPKVPELRPTFFSGNSLREFLNQIDDEGFRNLCEVAAFTGVRQGELLALKWNNVDLDNALIHIVNSDTFTTKNRKNRTLPLHPGLVELLGRMKRVATCELVFHAKDEALKPRTISKKFKRHVRKLKLDDELRFHSLRHSYATWLIQADVSVAKVQKLLGHSDIKTTMAYTHIQPESLHADVNRLCW